MASTSAESPSNGLRGGVEAQEGMRGSAIALTTIVAGGLHWEDYTIMKGVPWSC